MAINTEIRLFHKINDIRAFVIEQKEKGMSVGFVPTMGALHQGHMSLIKQSIQDTDVTIVSIFVNPTQFGPNEDLDQYPRTFEKDAKICRELGVNAIFAPEVAEMYSTPEDKIFKVIPPEAYAKKLCGIGRPGHFEGVSTVVTKLFNIIPAQKAFFGQKDAQQLFIIKKMVEDLCIPIEIIACPTQREADGLALSSRNINLDEHSRKIAPDLFKSLNFIKKAYISGNTDFELLSKQATKEILAKHKEISLEYLLAYDYNTFEKVKQLHSNTLVAIAAKIGGVRLIDNIVL